MTIGNKIKLLRTNKGITQEQLADYFGITMDELFDYKLNALTNKERFIKFMLGNGIVYF